MITRELIHPHHLYRFANSCLKSGTRVCPIVPVHLHHGMWVSNQIRELQAAQVAIRACVGGRSGWSFCRNVFIATRYVPAFPQCPEMGR